MGLPITNKRSVRTIGISSLSGGVNMRDSVSGVGDNQLTDAVNVWFHDGMLRTRPVTNCIDTVEVGNIGRDRVTGMHVFDDIINGASVLCAIRKTNIYTDRHGEEQREPIIMFFWCGERAEFIGSVPVSYDDVTFFVTEKSGVLYCYTSDLKIYTLNYRESGATWRELAEENYYAPIIAIHCKVENNSYFSGTMYEGYNLIGNRYRLIYSHYNPNYIGATEHTKNEMSYTFPENKIDNKLDYVGKKVVAKLRNLTGVVTHEVTLSYDPINDEVSGRETSVNTDGYVMFANLKGIDFSSELEFDSVVVLRDDETYIEDNLEITVPFIMSNSEKNKIFRMTRAEWFGGAALGLSGGTRLFLCGNTGENDKHLVAWSKRDEPTYFPDNAYFYAGNPTQRAMAFGKQDDKLVIFKEHETLYTYYVQNAGITAQDLINQSVVDYTSNAVYFPLITLNAKIGCDCPDTVQLCRNRLVWACSNGKVYTLVTMNNTNERNIFEIGEMIGRMLTAETRLKNAYSADWNGYYMIQCGRNVYLLDYNSYGYQYIYSYAKAEDAQLKAPWYVWELPVDGMLCETYGTLQLVEYKQDDTEAPADERVIAVYGFGAGGEDEMYSGSGTVCIPIRSIVQTKIFDFNLPNYTKNVELVNLQIGNNGGNPIRVSFVTDCGNEDEEIVPDGNDENTYSAGYVRNQRINPCIRSVVRMGVRMECDGGTLAIDGMTMNYRILGGAR